MSEQPFDIDAAQEQYEAERAGNAPKFEPDGDQPPDDTPPAKAAADDVFKSYDEYIADGGDPDLYKGKTAFQEDRDRFKENREMRRTIKDLNTTVQQTVEATSELLDNQRGTIRAELEAELKEAKANEDIDGALDAQNKINDLDETPPASRKQPAGEHPAILDFRADNPLIDPDSDDFNKEFNVDLEAFYNETFERLSLHGKQGVTPAQITRALTKALKDAKELHEDLFESPRNKRQTGSKRTTQRRTQGEPAPKAENFVPDDPSKPNQAPAVRDAIHKAAMKNAKRNGASLEDQQKAGDAAANKFEKSLMS